eukprot:gene3007-2929_t
MTTTTGATVQKMTEKRAAMMMREKQIMREMMDGVRLMKMEMGTTMMTMMSTSPM